MKRLSESAYGVYKKIINLTESGVMFSDGKVLRPVFQIVDDATVYCVRCGVLMVLSCQESLVRVASLQEKTEVESALFQDRVEVKLVSRGGEWSTPAVVLHSPGGRGFKK